MSRQRTVTSPSYNPGDIGGGSDDDGGSSGGSGGGGGYSGGGDDDGGSSPSYRSVTRRATVTDSIFDNTGGTLAGRDDPALSDSPTVDSGSGGASETVRQASIAQDLNRRINAGEVTVETSADATNRTIAQDLNDRVRSGELSVPGRASGAAAADIEAAVDTRVDRRDEPGAVASAVDTATDAFETANPGVSGGIDLAAASVRSESGAPIGDTGLTTPGGRNFDAFRGALEGPANTIDRAIGSGVERATLDPDNAPAGLGDVPLSDPATTTAAAALGTEAGRRGTAAGIERGLQSFNPAAAAQDAATITEAGIRGTDRVLDADEEDFQTGLDVADAVGETAVDAGPALGGALVAEDPARGFEAGATGVTIGAAGALGPSAAGSAARSGRRAADDVFGGRSLRRLLNDDRGQVDGSLGRRDTDEDSIEIDGSDIDPTDDFDPQRVTRSEVLDAPEAGPRRPDASFSQSFTQRTGSARRSDVPDRFDRGETAGEANPSFDARATFDRGDVPSDPLDRVGVDFGDLTASTRRVDDADASGGLLDPLDTRRPGEIEDSALEPVAAGAATGASVGGLLGERAREQAGEPLAGFDGVALGDLGDADTGSGTLGDEDGVGDLGGGLTGQGSETGVAPLEMIRATALTGSQAAQDTLAAQDQQGRLDAVGTGTGLGQRDIEQPNRGTGGREVPTGGGGFRPPRPPSIPTPDAEQPDEEIRFGAERDDALLSSGIAEAEDIADFGFSGSSSGGLGFDIDERDFSF